MIASTLTTSTSDGARRASIYGVASRLLNPCLFKAKRPAEKAVPKKFSIIPRLHTQRWETVYAGRGCRDLMPPPKPSDYIHHQLPSPSIASTLMDSPSDGPRQAGPGARHRCPPTPRRPRSARPSNGAGAPARRDPGGNRTPRPRCARGFPPPRRVQLLLCAARN